MPSCTNCRAVSLAIGAGSIRAEVSWHLLLERVRRPFQQQSAGPRVVEVPLRCEAFLDETYRVIPNGRYRDSAKSVMLMAADQGVRGPLAKKLLVSTGELARVPKAPLGGKVLHLG